MSRLPAVLRRHLTQRPNRLKILKNIGWLFVDKLLHLAVGLVVGVWLARELGPQQFGQLSFALALVGLGAGVAALGLKSIIVREIVGTPSDAARILGTAFTLRLLGAAVGLGALWLGVGYLQLDDQVTKLLVAILSGTLVFTSAEIIKCWFESQVAARYSIWVDNAVFLSGSAARIALLIIHAPLAAFAWLMLIEAALVAIGLFAIYQWQARALQAWSFSLARARSLLRDAWPLIIAGMGAVVYAKVDQIMLGQLIGEEAVGLYAVAARLSEVWYFLAVAITSSVRPTLFRLKQAASPQYLQRVQQSLNLMVWLSVPAALLTALSAQPLVLLLFGEPYADSAQVLIIHVWTGVFVFMGNAAWTWYLAENKQHLANIRIIFGLGINIALNALLIPHYGVVGAAWATLISRAVVVYFGQLLTKDTWPLFRMMTKALLLGMTWRSEPHPR